MNSALCDRGYRLWNPSKDDDGSALLPGSRSLSETMTSRSESNDGRRCFGSALTTPPNHISSRYSTVTLFAKFRGLSIDLPFKFAT